MTAVPKLSFKEQMHQAREQAILQSACRLLGVKAFDAMTMDDVAAEVGIAKASLYKHFCSKEELCAAAMAQLLQDVKAYLCQLPADMPPVERLQSLVRWTLQRFMSQEMPLMPSRNSTLRTVLQANEAYQATLATVSEQITRWIVEAQQQSTINPALPPKLVLYTLYARGCDPVVSFLQECDELTDEDIVNLVVRTCFDGLAARG